MNAVCRNCDHSFSKSYRFCPYCGQKAAVHRLTFSEFVHDVLHALLHADKGILHLIKELIYQPGRVARLYVEGKRKKYFNPFSFLVLMVAIAVLFILKFESFAMANNHAVDKSGLTHFGFKYFNVFSFIMCPLSALVIWMFFKKNKKSFIENLVLVAYTSGQTMFFYCLLLIPLILFTSSMVIIGVTSGILLACWTGMAILQFYQTWSFKSIVKVTGVIIILQILSQALVYFTFHIYKSFAS